MANDDLDGVAKNAAKLADEWPKVRAALASARNSHDRWTNAWVESARASPYFIGHVAAIGFPALAVIALVGWIV